MTHELPESAKTTPVHLLLNDVDAWNQWFIDSPVRPHLWDADLSAADLRGAYLHGANMYHANLQGANLCGVSLAHASLVGVNLSGALLDNTIHHENSLNAANLSDASFRDASFYRTDLDFAKCMRADFTRATLCGTSCYETDFTEAVLCEADLTHATLSHTNFTSANLSGCRVYGVSVWDINLTNAIQQDLVISRYKLPDIAVDSIELAQFIYLILNNAKLRDLLNIVSNRVVLILGRFSPERKEILNSIREELRKRDYVPVMFDFDRPVDRTLTETVMTLAGIAKFVIVDLSQPRSSPLEAHAVIPHFRIPFAPIVQAGESPFAMFADLQQAYPWVLPTITYKNRADLEANIDHLLRCIEQKHRELRELKSVMPPKPKPIDQWYPLGR